MTYLQLKIFFSCRFSYYCAKVISLKMADSELSSDQQEFLDQCNEVFKDRYSDKDEDFMKIKEAATSKPPIIVPWFESRQNRDGNRGRRSNYRNQGRRDTYNSNYERRDSRRESNDDHRRDRSPHRSYDRYQDR